MTISEALFQHLTESTQVKNHVGTRVYPTLLDMRAGFPAIGYEVRAVEPMMHSRGEAGIARADVTLTCWADDHEAADVVAEAVRLSLSGLKGTMANLPIRVCFVGDFADVTFVSEENERLNKAGKQTQLTIWHSQSVPAGLIS